MHHLSRLACLWLPLVLLVVAQPLTVTATLLTMDPPMRTRWGQAFARDMPFSPVDAQQAASWVALSLVASLLLGALLFKLVQRYGRNATALLGWGSGLWISAASFGTLNLRGIVRPSGFPVGSTHY